jgi:hypothetical protein
VQQVEAGTLTCVSPVNGQWIDYGDVIWQDINAQTVTPNNGDDFIVNGQFIRVTQPLV